MSEFLEKHILTLTVKSPLHIGDGRKYTKSDFVQFGSQVGILDSEKLLQKFASSGGKTLDNYEQYIFSRNHDMLRFLTNCGWTNQEIRDCCSYIVEASDAFAYGKPSTEISRFVRNGNNQLYVPGSGMKGVFRTLLLFQAMNGKTMSYQKLDRWNERNDFIGENRCFDKLSFRGSGPERQHNAAIGSILRGVSVSDSVPIDDCCLTLCHKMDAKPDGSTHELPISRECLIPGTKVQFALIIDRSIVGNQITVESIQQSVFDFSRFYKANFEESFDYPEGYDETVIDCDNTLTFGGGAGFFSKTLTYQVFGRNATKMLSEYFQQRAPKHRHDEDEDWGISPHTWKYTTYRGKIYPIGVCEVDIE